MPYYWQLKKMSTKNGASTERIILAIETGILGGSLALLKDGEAVGGWIGNQRVSRAEDILEEIGKLLDAGGVQKKSIGRITVSKGPGSFTGLRIGAALALGLKKSLDTVVTFHAVLESMLFNQNEKAAAICAVPFGKNQICWQHFPNTDETVSRNRSGKPRISQFEQFGTDIERLDFEQLILHENLYGQIIASNLPASARKTSEDSSGSPTSKDFRFVEKIAIRADENPARLIGLAAHGGKSLIDSHIYDLIYPQM